MFHTGRNKKYSKLQTTESVSVLFIYLRRSSHDCLQVAAINTPPRVKIKVQLENTKLDRNTQENRPVA
jgi:hypothetical protein